MKNPLHRTAIILFCLLLVAVAAFFVPIKKKPTAMSNNASQSDIAVTQQRADGGTKLAIPYFFASVTIPESLVAIEEIIKTVGQQQSDYTSLACGTLSLSTKSKNTLWLQYRDDRDPLCGTEIGFPLSSSIEYDMNGAAQPCDGLRRNLNYARCEQLALPGENGTITAAAWYQYIPDFYSETNGGTIAYVVALYRPQASQNHMILMALVPEKLSTTPKTFQQDAEALALEKISAKYNFPQESIILKSIVTTVATF